ncbi:CsbD family protein [Streptomyces sp. ACA25]|uniref:CsbD family protein n=1 Tax=Streptomyces sp. ACA25 TaxID=3022596 RepID=UPI002307E086|nr:CsbD family protein [Streptomyces sp. ACA25]MDB1086375.1 CsbD family protein [Streptomyces sp. ACA25]
MESHKGEGAMDKLKGKAKEAAGKVTGDKRKQTEGETDQAKGGFKESAQDMQDKAKGTKDSLSPDDDKT